MKCIFRPLTFFLAIPLCLCVCSSGYTGDPVQAASSSAQPNNAAARTAGSAKFETIIIPGPLRSFMRMAAISQKVSADDVLPLLARNVYMQGYQNGNRTEFLILLDRYLHQARRASDSGRTDQHDSRCQLRRCGHLSSDPRVSAAARLWGEKCLSGDG